MTITKNTTQQLADLRAAEPAGMAMWDAELRTHYHCPDWCKADPHTHDVDIHLGDRLAVVGHDGPEWGHFMAAGNTRAETGELHNLDVVPWGHLETGDPLTPEQLRQVAADALAAAEWLEAQR